MKSLRLTQQNIVISRASYNNALDFTCANFDAPEYKHSLVMEKEWGKSIMASGCFV